MIDAPTIKFTKKKFSEFEREVISKETPEEDLQRIFVVGYNTTDDAEATTENSNNVRLKLSEIISASGQKEIITGTVLKEIKADATLSADGYQIFTKDENKLILFDTSVLGKYIQVQKCDPSLMNNGVVKNNLGQDVEATILDVCFTGATLGDCIKLYLPDFGPIDSETITTPYALRLWRVDPREDAEHNPYNVNMEGQVVFVSDPVHETPLDPEDDKKKYYDWFVKFIMLATGISDAGLFKYVARTSEVVNIYDNDEIQ